MLKLKRMIFQNHLTHNFDHKLKMNRLARFWALFGQRGVMVTVCPLLWALNAALCPVVLPLLPSLSKIN